MTSLTKTLRILGQASLTGAVLFSSLNGVVKPASAVEPANVRFFQDYSWCDAQMLGEFWGIGPGNAKFDAGHLIQNGQQSVVETKLSAARQYYSGQGLCNFSNEGYSYDDMVAVADYWQVSVYDAKISINNKLEAGYHRAAQDVVQNARQYAQHQEQSVAFERLSRDGQPLGSFSKQSDGTWVELSASGAPRFSFREVERNPLVTTLVDESRGVEIRLDYHFHQIQYRLTSDQRAPQALYAMSF